MNIKPFTGGKQTARDKLNTMREVLAGHDNTVGDGFIMVDRTVDGGITLRLSMDRVLERIPRKPNPTTSFPVMLELENPTATGDDVTDCAFTYTVMNIHTGANMDGSSTTPSTGMTPLKRRFPLTEYTPFTPDSGVTYYGLAFYNENNELVLWDANELPASEDCDA